MRISYFLACSLAIENSDSTILLWYFGTQTTAKMKGYVLFEQQDKKGKEFELPT